jgi:hypothetical protein
MIALSMAVIIHVDMLVNIGVNIHVDKYTDACKKFENMPVNMSWFIWFIASFLQKGYARMHAAKNMQQRAN